MACNPSIHLCIHPSLHFLYLAVSLPVPSFFSITAALPVMAPFQHPVAGAAIYGVTAGRVHLAQILSVNGLNPPHE
jgi:hypothetical protein